MLTLEQRRDWAICSGMRLETITAILARRRRCSQLMAMRLAKTAAKIGLNVEPQTLAMNLFAHHPIFSRPAWKF